MARARLCLCLQRLGPLDFCPGQLNFKAIFHQHFQSFSDHLNRSQRSCPQHIYRTFEEHPVSSFQFFKAQKRVDIYLRGRHHKEITSLCECRNPLLHDPKQLRH